MGWFNRPFRDLNRCFPLLRDPYGDLHHGHGDHGDHGDPHHGHGDHGGRGDRGVSRVSCACGVPSDGLRGRRGVRCRSHLLRGLSPPPPSPGLFPSEGFKSLMHCCVFSVKVNAAVHCIGSIQRNIGEKSQSQDPLTRITEGIINCIIAFALHWGKKRQHDYEGLQSGFAH